MMKQVCDNCGREIHNGTEWSEVKYYVRGFSSKKQDLCNRCTSIATKAIREYLKSECLKKKESKS